ncbi:hypothetical protein TRVL_08983 [Trypanosoma vivax]|nr:hypothetical protein TRVL_08983 [Trypanosoma vivax]
MAELALHNSHSYAHRNLQGKMPRPTRAEPQNTCTHTTVDSFLLGQCHYEGTFSIGMENHYYHGTWVTALLQLGVAKCPLFRRPYGPAYHIRSVVPAQYAVSGTGSARCNVWFR